MKKILMVCEAYGGGVFTYVSQLCNDMIDEFDVYLAYSIRPQTPTNYRAFVDPRVHMIELKYLNNQAHRSLRNCLKAIRELRSIEQEVNPSIIHLHSSIAGGIGRLAYSGKKNAVVYTPHGYAHVLMGPGVKSFVYKAIEIILGKSNSITLTCCKSEDEVAASFCKRTEYIETGINIGEIANLVNETDSKKNEKFTVFTLGRACIQKQPQLFNEIAKLVPEANFVWIGNGEMENLLSAPNVTVTGWKSRRDAIALAKGADVFVLCSLGEAIAMSLIENMFIKKLILVSNTMGNKSVIKNGVNGYICDTAQEYASRIKDAMKRFPVQLTEKAYEDVLNIYNTEVMKQKYIRFYNRI